MRNLTEENESYVSPEIVQTKIRENIVHEQNKYENKYHQNKNVYLEMKIGDIVYMKRNPVSTGVSTKLQMAYGGPLLIVDKISNEIYRVKKLNDFNDRGFETTAHISQLKIWKGDCQKENNDKNETNSREDEWENKDIVTESKNEIICDKRNKRTVVNENVRRSTRVKKNKFLSGIKKDTYINSLI